MTHTPRAGEGAEPLPLYIQRFLTGAPALPIRAHEGDAGWDLFASRELSIGPGAAVNIHTDIAIALPEGWFGHILGRSSMLRVRGLLVTPAVIDSGYRGELFVQVQNVHPREETVRVEVGQRIAQLLLLPVPVVRWQEVEALPNSDRGSHGFGSTGA